MERKFGVRRQELLRERDVRQARIDAGERPDFLPETASVREGDWSIAPVPADLQDRRVEITGPAGDRKMVINAFNSGAYVYMADFEDANSPTWDNSMDGQVNLRDAVNGTIRYRNPDGKEYRLNDKAATLKVRPRGWHLEEKHIQVTASPFPLHCSISDFSSFIMRELCCKRAADLTFICRKWRAIGKPGSGTTYSSMPRMRSASLRARSRLRC